ncbi:17661_t:CDS:2 [Acaulospora morrowiae]|uniref:17661_t:CDS:1 n=1 Tax=Acaulospora morrowiae TaxID=94023 RepID=A0A9N9HXZ6_9GLOM|nr:17661_t:CDS:2 [Acaulospora morrowiae]
MEKTEMKCENGNVITKVELMSKDGWNMNSEIQKFRKPERNVSWKTMQERKCNIEISEARKNIAECETKFVRRLIFLPSFDVTPEIEDCVDGVRHSESEHSVVNTFE